MFILPIRGKLFQSIELLNNFSWPFMTYQCRFSILNKNYLPCIREKIFFDIGNIKSIVFDVFVRFFQTLQLTYWRTSDDFSWSINSEKKHKLEKYLKSPFFSFVREKPSSMKKEINLIPTRKQSAHEISTNKYTPIEYTNNKLERYFHLLKPFFR